MTTPRDEDTLTMDGWPGGMNNRVRETEQVIARDGENIPSSQFLRRALNVDLTAEGHPLRRRGRRLVLSGRAHSAYYWRRNKLLVLVLDNQLMVGPSVSELTAAAVLSTTQPLQYAEFLDKLFFVGGGDTRGHVTASGSAGGWGSLGLGEAPPTTLSQRLNNVTTTTEQFEGQDFIGGQSQQVIKNIPTEAPVNYSDMPGGSFISSLSGRLYVADGNEIWFSEPFTAAFTRKATNFFVWEDEIRMMLAVEDGLYVGDNGFVHFLRCIDPLDPQRLRVYSSGIVPNAFAHIPGHRLGLEREQGDVPVWWCLDGSLMAGLPGGRVTQLTQDKVAVPEHSFGAVSLREREGMIQIVSSLQKGGDANNMAASDTVIAEVRRNDLTVESE